MECNSAGGPIGQWPAAKRPNLAQGLTLCLALFTALAPIPVWPSSTE